MDPFAAGAFMNQPVFFLMTIVISIIIFGFIKGAVMTTIMLAYTVFTYVGINTGIQNLELLTWILIPGISVAAAWEMYAFFFEGGSQSGGAPQ